MKKILIVEDETALRDLLALQIQGSYQVFEASNGQVAIQMARQEKPHAIIMDIMMPGMDGTEVAAVLREDARTRDIPIIFLTGLAEGMEGADSSGAMPRSGPMQNSIVLSKPLNIKNLMSVLSRLLPS